ncbi:uncharacterized protein Bfra_000937 [Botrytis fragariae]|uniref:Uncharacterized protein n=1 Tax=Botrytis fragariae TaxID=1964551 RepID=A0A8H6B3G1_9HELO|nr:uncharacterized protein Bfra_000937 [Botrytis fragariae]KAF5878768.1 hypothetical protein Bfra_000937 [Botrytis fragariae]
MSESTSTPALDPTKIRSSPKCLSMPYNQFGVVVDVLQARQEVIEEALEIMTGKQNRDLALLQQLLDGQAADVMTAKPSTTRTASSRFRKSGVDLSMSEDHNDRLLFHSIEWINTGAGLFLKTKRKNYKEWSGKWKEYLMGTVGGVEAVEGADDGEKSLKKLLES